MGCQTSKNAQEPAALAKPLFRRHKVGTLEVPNRFVVASTTRLRCGPDGVPNDMMVQYYAARASAGIIITESAGVSALGNCYPIGGAIYNDAHAAGWKRVTDAVHAKGGRIYIQVYHAGRVAHPDQIGGQTPISSSPIAADGEVHTQNGRQRFVQPKEATVEDIKEVVQQFKKAAELAKKAGFDGIELQAGAGQLIDQFLRNSVNKRTDTYGGSVENRTRLLLEVVDQLIAVFSAGRVGVKVAPNSGYNDVSDSDPIGLFQHVAKALNQKKIAFLEVAENFSFDATNAQLKERFFADKQHKNIRAFLKPHFSGAYIANAGYDHEEGNRTIQAGEADLISFGTHYICNPDLVERLKENKPLRSLANVKDQGKIWTAYFYAGTAEGYTDVSVYEA